MEKEYLPKKNLHVASLFSLGIFIKIFILHAYMGIDNNFFIITISNVVLVTVIFGLIFLCREEKRISIYLTVNMGLSILFLMDIMYFSHFFTLIPVHSIYQIGQLGPVSNSVVSLIKPHYLLFFIDTLLLWVFFRKKQITLPVLKKKQKKVLAMTLFLLIIVSSVITYKTSIDTEGHYTPYNLGVVNYHLYDIVNFFIKSPLDIDRVEAIMDTINHVDSNQKGFELAKERNVIVIQAESIQNFVINREINGQSITPVLNNLINNDSVYFSHYYEQVGWGNTSDAEFISHNSFYPSTKTFSYKAFEDNDFATLPMLLKAENYSTIAFHGNQGSFWNRESIYPAQGIDTFISLEKLQEDELIGIGLSDGSLFKQSVDFLKEQSQPFYSFYITLTSHHPFVMENEYKGLNLQGTYEGTLLEDYLQTVHYFDNELGKYIELLKKEGLYDNSIIVIYGDHEGLNMNNEEANHLLTSFLGKPYEEDEMFRVPFIVHIPNSGIKEEVRTVGGQIDFFPTMANLLGLEIQSNKVLGKDLLNTKDGFVAKQVHVARGSFIDNEKIFIMSNDGIFENSKAWNIHTGEVVDLQECREGYERALAEISLSEYVLQNNLVSTVKEKGLEYILQLYP